MRTLTRIVAAGDIAGGLALAVAAAWFGEQVDVATWIVRFVGIATLILGVDLLLLRCRGIAPRIAMATEAVLALLALDVLVLQDPTGLGAVLLVATALYGAAMAIELALLERRPSPVLA